MLSFRSWSKRRKAAVAATLALLLWIPQGISTDDQPVVTGHSTFYDGKGYDRCLASIAGIMKTDVKWFNDMVLVERYGGRGNFIYVTENASENPTDRAGLWSEGVFYDFVDPNGVHWHVDEAFMMNDNHVRGGVNGDPLGRPGSQSVDPPGVGEDRTYVWIVELSEFPIHDQFAGDPQSRYFHDIYNFLVLVDTCKFHRNPVTNFNGNSQDFNVTHDNTTFNQPLGPGNGHPSGEGPHTHESFIANLWVGKQPVLVPIGADGDGASYTTSWAANPQTRENAQRAPGTYQNATGVDP